MQISGAEFARKAQEAAYESTGRDDREGPFYVYPGKGKGKKTMDCQAFVEYVLSLCGVRKNWRGSNAMWRDMAWRGTPEECRKTFGRIPPGAWLFIVDTDTENMADKYRKDGLGNAGHVGIYTGLGKGAVHSSASRGGVCQSAFQGKTVKNGGWNRVGLPDFIRYDLPAGAEAVEESGTENLTETARVTADQVRFRTAPSTSAPWHGRLDAGTPVRVLEKGNSWCRVSCGGKTGYIMTVFLEPAGETESEGTEKGTETEQEKGEKDMRTMRIVSENGGKVRMRPDPSTNGHYIARLEPGTLVKAGEEENGWRPVLYGGREGYIMAEYLEDVKEDAVEGAPGDAKEGNWQAERTALLQACGDLLEKIRDFLASTESA